jgi:hypothetical protein
MANKAYCHAFYLPLELMHADANRFQLNQQEREIR